MALLKVVSWVVLGPWTFLEGIVQGHIGMLVAGFIGTALWVELIGAIL